MDYTLDQISKMIDHSLLHPTMTDGEIEQGCEIAKMYKVAAVCVKPYSVKKAVEILKDTEVFICSVIGFPHGNSHTKIKQAETKLACKEGANEIDMVVNIGKVRSGDWVYVRKEIAAIQKECKKNQAILKVIFENDYLPDDKTKIKLCKICNKIKVAFIKTSTGYGYVKNVVGDYNYQGATEKDILLMRKHADADMGIKAAGGIRTLDDLLKYRSLGVSRIGATATVAILEEAKKRLGLSTSDFLYEAPKGY